MHHLYLDIETYSSVDLGKAGAYKYAQSPDFEVLLLSYSLDRGPVATVDLTRQALPAALREALLSSKVAKHAHNAAFEWYCLSRYLGLAHPEMWLPQWHCTMLHCLYCGYPGSLAAAGAALSLPQDKQKDRAGKALLRYFSLPCAPTQANGGRTRNLPQHDPAKWQLYIDYNRQDVVTEMAIEDRLSRYPVPEAIHEQWVLDLAINYRGIGVDLDLVRGALELGEQIRQQLTQEAITLTGLANPNSMAQLTRWLGEETGEEVDNLRKDTVADLLAGNLTSGAARRMLEIRQELGKTSTKKYATLVAATGHDGRIRGTLQFYGANRTGRWAGRLLQVQNLPRTYLPALDTARAMVKRLDLDGLRLLYGSVPDTLSQLIRTALVPRDGCVFLDADFSAIEARVVAWLAGEEWVLDVFRGHGKIYEATAAQMFGVPIEHIRRGRPEYALRQRGKVATLALGYQGGPNALVNMGALRMGIPEADLPDIVTRWRAANPNIVRLWYTVEQAAIHALQTGRQVSVRGKLTLARNCDPVHGLDYLIITLPSGRELYYAHPRVTANKWGKPSLAYRGVNQKSRSWAELEAYGGKLVENCVQAIARDCLAEAIERLDSAGYAVVMHVHDEVVLEVPEAQADLADVTAIMSQPVPWAPDLPLAAAGWIGDYYTKD